MTKYLVETFYTCSFKITHKLDELSEKKFSELEKRKDGQFEIIDVKLNNRKTKTINKYFILCPSLLLLNQQAHIHYQYRLVS